MPMPAGSHRASPSAARDIQTKSIASSTLWQFGSQITMAAMSIIMVKFVALALSQELAGEYNSAYGYLQLFGILADFGLYAVAVREVSRVSGKEREHVLGTLLTLRCLILALSMGSALLVAWLIPAWRGTPLPLGITIAAFVPSFVLLSGIIRVVFQIEYKMHFIFIAEVSQRLLTLLLTGILIWMGVRDSTDTTIYYYFLAIGGLGALLLFLLSVIFGARLQVVRPHFDKRLLRSLALKAAPYGIAFLATALYRQFDVTLIALLRDDYPIQNAYYGFVQRMMDMAYLLPTFLLNSTLPILSERDAKGEDTRSLLGKTFVTILLIGSTAFLFSVLWPRPLMELLTRESYLSTATTPGADTALALLSVSMFCNGIILFAFYSLLTKHVWKPLVITLLLGSVVSVALNIVLIPQYGFVGASFTSIITHLLLAILLLPQSLRVLPMKLTGEWVARWAGFTALLGLCLWLMRPLLTGSLQTFGALILAIPLLGIIAWITGIQRLFRA